MQSFDEIPRIDEIKQVLCASLGDKLQEAEAIGLFGSLARGNFCPKSDIDVFVVIDDRLDRVGVDEIWWTRIKQALRPFGKDITVVIYTLRGLREVSNWYVLRLAAEGVLFYDQGKVGELFQKIIVAARKGGLVQKAVGDSLVWSIGRRIDIGESFEIKLED